MSATRAVAKPAKVGGSEDDDFPGDRPSSLPPGQEVATRPIAGTDVILRGSTAIAAYDFGDTANRGHENVDMDTILVPFLTVLHYQCPQIVEADPQYVEGAKPGMMFDTGSKEIFDGRVGMEALFVYTEHLYTKWIPRNREDGGGGGSGGFRGIASLNDPIAVALREKYKYQKMPYFDPDANEGKGENIEFVEQQNVGIVYGVPNFEECEFPRTAILALTSTRLKPYRAFMTQLTRIRYFNPLTRRMDKPALYTHRNRIVTVPQSEGGQHWFNFSYRLAMPGRSEHSALKPDGELFRYADAFYEAWRGGSMQADYEGMADATGSEDDVIPM